MTNDQQIRTRLTGPIPTADVTPVVETPIDPVAFRAHLTSRTCTAGRSWMLNPGGGQRRLYSMSPSAVVDWEVGAHPVLEMPAAGFPFFRWTLSTGFRDVVVDQPFFTAEMDDPGLTAIYRVRSSCTVRIAASTLVLGDSAQLYLLSDIGQPGMIADPPNSFLPYGADWQAPTVDPDDAAFAIARLKAVALVQHGSVRSVAPFVSYLATAVAVTMPPFVGSSFEIRDWSFTVERLHG